MSKIPDIWALNERLNFDSFCHLKLSFFVKFPMGLCPHLLIFKNKDGYALELNKYKAIKCDLPYTQKNSVKMTDTRWRVTRVRFVLYHICDMLSLKTYSTQHTWLADL